MKLILKLFSILLIVLLIGVGIFLWTFDINQYRSAIADELSATIQRPVSIEKIEMKASFVPTIRLKNLVIGNPQGFEGKEAFLTADSIEGTIALAPLLEKRVQIYDIKIGKVSVNAVHTPQMNNLDFSVASEKAAQPKSAAANSETSSYLNNLNIDDISALRINVSYQNETKTYQFAVNDLNIQQLRMMKFVLDYDNKMIRFSGNIDLLKLLTRQDNFVFNSEVEVWGLTGKLSGSIGNMKQLKNMLLNIDMYSDQFANVLTQANTSFAVPVSSFTLSTILKGDLSRFSIENFKMSMDNALEVNLKGTISDVLTDLSGTVEGEATLSKSLLTDMYGLKPMNIALKGSVSADKLNIEKFSVNANRSDADIVLSLLRKGDKYIINGTVDSNYLDKNDFLNSDEQSVDASNTLPNKTANQAKETSEKNVLPQLSGQINWNLKNVKLFDSSDDYYGFFGRTIIDNDTITVTPLQIRTIAGLFNGTLKVADISTAVPNMQVNISAENINLDKFKTFADIVTGSTANLSAQFNTKGLNVADVTSNLNGSAEIEITEGRVVNKWFNALPETVGLLQKSKSFSYSKTDMESLLNCAVINVKATNGVLSMDKSVAVETSTLNLLLTGTINLPEQKMSLSILPQLPMVKDSKALSLAQVIRLEGTFNAPSVRVDGGDVLKEAAKFGFDKLLDKAGLQSENAQEAVVGSLCETALGHKLKGKVSLNQPQTSVSVENEKAAKPSVEVKKKLSPQEELKNQLIKSISSVIK